MLSPEVITQRKEKLSNARSNLKAKFIGIDVVIDKLIDSISSWYIFPEASTRPLIVNLWGMTGVGKTDLIRSLASELSMQDKLCDVQMVNNSTEGRHNCIRAKMNSVSLSSNDMGILLLDEIQKFRSIDSDGNEIPDTDSFEDVWSLLSDGKLVMTDRLKHRLTEIICETKFNAEQGFKETNKKNKKLKYHREYYDARDIKMLLNMPESIEEVMSMEDDALMELLLQKSNDPSFYEPKVFSKLLIVISGNLDEAYSPSGIVSDADRDADIVNETTKEITVVNIKKALRSRFRPEQIARFGNTHIIYPSLDRQSFEKIIRRKMDHLVQEMHNVVKDISIKFGNSVYEMLYNNGVFPTQGVRPVYTTIDNFFNEIIPDTIIKCMSESHSSVLITYSLEDEELSMLYSDGSIQKRKYIGTLDDIRKTKKMNKQKRCLVAVHEAGHALVYAVLYGQTPKQILINTTSADNEGFVSTLDVCHTKETMLDDMCVMYGGRCAEILVFGDKDVSTGAHSDINNATSIAAKMIRSHEMYRHAFRGVIRSQTDDDSEVQLTNIEDTNKKLHSMLDTAAHRATGILEDNKALLIEVAERLMEHNEIKREDFCALVNNYGIECVVNKRTYEVTADYLSSFDTFKTDIEGNI